MAKILAYCREKIQSRFYPGDVVTIQGNKRFVPYPGDSRIIRESWLMSSGLLNLTSYMSMALNPMDLEGGDNTPSCFTLQKPVPGVSTWFYLFLQYFSVDVHSFQSVVIFGTMPC